MKTKVFIIGGGGVGVYLSIALERWGIPVVVYDGDTLDGGGATRLPAVNIFGQTLLRKAAALRVCGVKAMPQYVTRASDIPDCDIVIDATDASSSTRKQFLDVARRKGAEYIRASYDLLIGNDGLPGEVLVSLTNTVGFGRAEGYRNAPAAHHAMIAAGYAAEHILRHIERGIPLPGVVRIPLNPNPSGGENVQQ
ncbi:MAG: hypothetical protein N2595_07860 [bacterium]|nr:hypothetical protein [bacterium]